MKVIGIIAEYNPFHNGHLYHINKIKELYKDSIIILILNGYFMQRGELSILTKEDKVRISLEFDVNLVVELPFVYGTQSADIFADASISILNELKVDKIIFGSECNNKDLLAKVALTQIENKDYDTQVKKYLKEGINYPTAMYNALDTQENINQPNDLLGISYIKSIIKNKYNIEYETIKRTSDYHDNKSNSKVISASNIRNKLINKKEIKKYLPNISYKYIKTINFDYFELLKYKILTDHNLNSYLDVDEGVENRLKRKILLSSSKEELIANVKTKRYTYNRINRMFIHILIGLTKEDNKNKNLDYIKILGFDKKGKKYLNSIKKDINLPIYNNKLISHIKDYEIKASLIYDMITKQNTYLFEIKNKPIEKD